MKFYDVFGLVATQIGILDQVGVSFAKRELFGTVCEH